MRKAAACTVLIMTAAAAPTPLISCSRSGAAAITRGEAAEALEQRLGQRLGVDARQGLAEQQL